MYTTIADMLVTHLGALADQLAPTYCLGPSNSPRMNAPHFWLTSPRLVCRPGRRGNHRSSLRCLKTGKSPRRWSGTRTLQTVCCPP